jgi:hypothetical protein
MKITPEIKQKIWEWLMAYKAGERDEVGGVV